MVDYSAIAAHYSGPPKGNSNIAKAILLNAQVKRGPTVQPVQNEPSFVSRLFDILSRPRYAVANTLKGLVEEGDLDIKDFISGLAGTQKTSFTDVLKETGMEEGPGRSVLGLGLDIVADPINFVPVAGVVNKFKAAKEAKKVIPEVTALQKQLSRGEPINPELYGMPAVENNIPAALAGKAASSTPVNFPRDVLAAKVPVEAIQGQLDLPGITPKFQLPEITPAAGKAPKTGVTGQIPLKLPDINVTAAKKSAPEIVDDIAVGAAPNPVPFIRGIEFEPRHAALADEILAKFSPDRSKAQLNLKHPDTLNPKQQVWLYYRAMNEAKRIAKKKDWSAAHANKVYAAVESSLREQGYVPRLFSGENVSIFDVIRQLGGPKQATVALDNFAKDMTPDNPLFEAVEGLRAANAIDESKSVQFILDKALESKVALKGSQTLSDASVDNVVKLISKFSKKAADTAPISAAATDTTKKLLDRVLMGDRSVAQVAIDAKAGMIDDILSKGKGPRPELNGAVTRALEKDLGKLPTWVNDSNKAVEFFMGRVATWWGQKDLRPLSLTSIGAAAATASARGKALNALFKNFDETQRIEAISVAQGLTQATSVHTARLADQISDMMSNLVGRTAGTSVVTRSAVDMNLLNKWMRQYGTKFQFTKSNEVKDVLGNIHDFSKGTDWLDSWKTANPEMDPEQWLFRFQQAMEQATREKALFDEIGERFGQKLPGGGFRTKLEGHPYLEGYYFPDEIAKQLPRVIKDWTTPAKLSEPLMKHYDRLLSMWKSGVTIYRPAHHIRNYIGDVYLGWMDNVRSLRPYTIAARVQRTLKDMYPTLMDVDKLVDLGVISQKMGTPRVGEIIFRNQSGVPFTAQQIAAVAHQKGLLEHARTIEDIIDLGENARFKPFGGKVQAVGRAASELTSHNTRLAHFIDKVMKSRGNNLEEIFEQASRRARKWHPSGLDLTDFEKRYMRRVIPFYAWMRKSTPLLLEGLVMNPGKVLAVPKVYGAIQEAQGMETGGIGQPFPTDQMFPEWLRAEGLGPLSGPEGWLGAVSNQDPPGYVMAGQGLNPLTSLMAQISNPGKTLISSLTPAIGVPVSLASGRNLSTGEPISGIDARPGAMEEYIGAQIPIWSMAQSITGVTPFGTDTKRAGPGQTTQAILNWLTASGIQGTGPYIKQAQYEKIRPLQVQRASQREKFLQQLQEDMES